MKTVKSIGLFFAICIMTFTIGTLTGMEITLHRQRELKKDLNPFELQIAQMDEKPDDTIPEEGTQEFESFLDVSALACQPTKETELPVADQGMTQSASFDQRDGIPKREEGYYLAFMDSKIVVLLEDKKTVYFTTDVSSQMLPEDLRQQIMQLLYVENEKELFDFLESYSS